MLTTVEAIGDITATEEASSLATVGERHNKRIQGGLLGDGTPTFNQKEKENSASLGISAMP